MRLNDILKGIDVLEVKGNRTCDIINFHFDSRLISENDMFIAINGVTQDGSKFINSAIKNGAKTIISDLNFQGKKGNVLFIRDKNVRKLTPQIASKFYKDKPKNLIAVTGTNGKSSIASLYFQILKNRKFKVS